MCFLEAYIHTFVVPVVPFNLLSSALSPYSPPYLNKTRLLRLCDNPPPTAFFYALKVHLKLVKGNLF